jgi:vitamin B12 transporter
MRFRFIPPIAVLLLLSFAISAAPIEIRDEIVVTASADAATAGNTPAAATVITREEIERREAREVADVLREVPGVLISRSGSPGKAASIFVRGGSSKHALVLWNGIEINNPLFSGYNLGQFSTAGVERVEVVSGPYSALYGSEAVSGVVNILTTSDRAHFATDVEAGGKGLLNGVVAAGSGKGAFSASAAIEHRQDDGFAPNDDFRQDSVTAAVTWTPRTDFSIGFRGRYAEHELGIPRNVNAAGDAFVPTPNRREDGDEYQVLLPVRFELASTRFDAKLSRVEREDNFQDPEDPFFRTEASALSTTDRATLSAARELSIGTLTVGGEWERAVVDDSNSYGTNLDDNRRTGQALFAEDRISARLRDGSAVEVTLGVRYDDFDTFGSQLSPRVAAAWLKGPHKFRAAFGDAFRAPAVGELYYPFFGNPALQPESSRSIEAGYDGYFSRGTVSVTAFHGDYDDLIVYDTVAQTFGNVGAATAYGVELGTSRRLTDAWSAALSYTWLRTEQVEIDAPLLRRPEHSGSASLDYERGPLSATMVVVHTGGRADVTDLFPFGRVTADAYTTADLTLRYRLGRVVPYLKFENLTDERYEEVFGYPSARRRAVAGIRYALR